MPPELTVIDRAMRTLPSGHFLLTAAFESARAGQIVQWAQACASEPRLVCIAARKGHSVEPLIRDSHAFALCTLAPDDRFVLRKFSGDHPPDEGGDPFDAVDVERLATGSPVLRRCVCALDCVVVRHFDLEADHEIYIGEVVAGKFHGA